MRRIGWALLRGLRRYLLGRWTQREETRDDMFAISDIPSLNRMSVSAEDIEEGRPPCLGLLEAAELGDPRNRELQRRIEDFLLQGIAG